MPNNPKPVFTTDSDTASLISNSNIAQDVLALRGTSNSVPNTVIDIVTTRPITIMKGNIKGSTDSNAIQYVIRTIDLDGLSEVIRSKKHIYKK
jgi:hypothetical protein